MGCYLSGATGSASALGLLNVPTAALAEPVAHSLSIFCPHPRPLSQSSIMHKLALALGAWVGWTNREFAYMLAFLIPLQRRQDMERELWTVLYQLAKGSDNPRYWMLVRFFRL